MSPRRRTAGPGRDDPGPVLGARIRARRHDLGLTLKQVAAMSGLSHPFLSQVERGLARPSVVTLQQLANVLGTTTYTLLAPRVGSVRLRRRGERPPLDDDGIRATEITAPPADWSPRKVTEPGQVVIYVADGSLETDVAGTRYRMDAGDTIIFDGRLPHDVRSLDGPRTRYLSILVP